MYVLRRSDGAFVAPAGQSQSYTPLLQEAVVYTTRELAEANRCPGNEFVIPIQDLLHMHQPATHFN